MNHEALIQTITQCAKHCSSCAGTCLQEAAISEHADCIRICLECAEVCHSTTLLLVMNSSFSDQALQLCRDICLACMKICSDIPEEHCQQCATACKETAEQCEAVVQAS
jgi:hypothetical protein